MAVRRRFGRVRHLPSGRYQVRYLGPDGVDRPAPSTFATKTDAEKWLVKTEAEIQDDRWLDPDLGRVTFGEYAQAWVRERPELRPHTVAMYRYMLTRISSRLSATARLVTSGKPISGVGGRSCWILV